MNKVAGPIPATVRRRSSCFLRTNDHLQCPLCSKSDASQSIVRPVQAFSDSRRTCTTASHSLAAPSRQKADGYPSKSVRSNLPIGRKPTGAIKTKSPQIKLLLLLLLLEVAPLFSDRDLLSVCLITTLRVLATRSPTLRRRSSSSLATCPVPCRSRDPSTCCSTLRTSIGGAPHSCLGLFSTELLVALVRTLWINSWSCSPSLILSQLQRAQSDGASCTTWRSATPKQQSFRPPPWRVVSGSAAWRSTSIAGSWAASPTQRDSEGSRFSWPSQWSLVQL
uniref:Uncharacterized protein n=1 Tax=Hyaloperonospora arabidopsidis (strain Emoy2) TaxID=559515 RepID=M4C5F0_HYAAE